MYLYLDTTSATGVWQWKNRMDDPTQPHLIRVAAMLWNNETNQAADTYCALIKAAPDWPPIPHDGYDRHGIDDADLRVHGVPLRTVMSRLSGMIGAAGALVMQNTQFHQRMLWRGYRDINQALPQLPRMICTMLEAKNAMRSAKWVSLAESHSHFAKEPLYLPADAIQRGLAIVGAVRAVHYAIAQANPTRALGKVFSP